MTISLSERLTSYTLWPPKLTIKGIRYIAYSPISGILTTGRGVINTAIDAKKSRNDGDEILRTVSLVAIGTAKAFTAGILATLSSASNGCKLIIMAAIIPPGGVMYEMSLIVRAVSNTIENVASNLSLRICNAVASRYGNANPANAAAG